MQKGVKEGIGFWNLEFTETLKFSHIDHGILNTQNVRGSSLFSGHGYITKGGLH